MTEPEKIWTYILKEMTPAQRLAFEEELQNNAQMNTKYVALQELHDTLKGEELDSPSDRFTSNVMQALPVNITRSYFQTSPPKRWVLNGFLIMTAMLLFAALALGDLSEAGAFQTSFNALVNSSAAVVGMGVAIGMFTLLWVDYYLEKRITKKIK